MTRQNEDAKLEMETGLKECNEIKLENALLKQENDWLKKDLDQTKSESEEFKIQCKTQASSIQFLEKNNSEQTHLLDKQSSQIDEKVKEINILTNENENIQKDNVTVKQQLKSEQELKESI